MSTMDAHAIWEEVQRFHESGLATTASMHAGAQERVLVEQFLQKVPLEVLFQKLQEASDADDAEKVKTICACINRVLGCDGERMFFQPEMIPFIIAGLQHTEHAARVLTLNQLTAHLKANPTLDQVGVLATPLLLDALCNVMGDEEVDVSAKASSVLAILAQADERDYYKPVVDALNSIASSSNVSESSVEFMRYLEALANVIEQNEKHMTYAIETSAIDAILKCLSSNDALFVMNVLDLVPKLCRTKSGLMHVFESGTLQTLLNMAKDPLIGDSALRLIGEISASAAKLKMQSWNWTDPMLSKAFFMSIETKLQSSEPLQKIAAVDAIAAFASTSEKELHLFIQHKHLCKLMLALAGSTKMDLKANFFHALARILGEPTRLHRAVEAVPEENASLWSLLEQLFQSVGPESGNQQDTMTLLMTNLRQPFEELRIAVFRLLQAVAAQNNDWGVRTLQSYGGFIEFLLDRTTEPTKVTREWKFAIVDALLGSPFVDRLDAITRGKLTEHLRIGPYVGKAPLEMEMEAM